MKGDPMTDDLVTWLPAQLDDAERVALEANGEGRWYSAHILRVNLRASDASAEHIARHDPARVLRMVERDRRILDEHPPIREPYGWAGRCERCIDGDDPWAKDAEWPCLTVRLLALSYDDRPGYRDAWKP